MEMPNLGPLRIRTKKRTGSYGLCMGHSRLGRMLALLNQPALLPLGAATSGVTAPLAVASDS